MRKLELEKKVSAVGKKGGGGRREKKRRTNDWIFSQDFSPREQLSLARPPIHASPLLSLSIERSRQFFSISFNIDFNIYIFNFDRWIIS